MTEKALAEIPEKQDGMLSLIERLATNPDVDVDKIKQFLDMQEHIMDKNAKQAFNAAMVRAQQEMPIVPRDKKNEQTGSMYSKYETILKHCKPIYTKHGFSISFYEGETPKEGEIRIMADVMHEEGHTKTYWTDIPLDATGIKGSVNKTATHAKGSSNSYGRSYLMKMIFNIPTGDEDDGNTAGSQAITDEQLLELEAMIEDNQLTKKDPKYIERVCKFFKVDNMAAIPAKRFNDAKNSIQAVINKGKK